MIATKGSGKASGTGISLKKLIAVGSHFRYRDLIADNGISLSARPAA